MLVEGRQSVDVPACLARGARTAGLRPISFRFAETADVLFFSISARIRPIVLIINQKSGLLEVPNDLRSEYSLCRNVGGRTLIWIFDWPQLETKASISGLPLSGRELPPSARWLCSNSRLAESMPGRV